MSAIENTAITVDNLSLYIICPTYKYVLMIEFYLIKIPLSHFSYSLYPNNMFTIFQDDSVSSVNDQIENLGNEI